MEWLVKTVEAVSTIPSSIDSSNPEIIKTGLAAYTGAAGRPMINSVALERLDTIKLVTENNAHVVVTAAGESGMPDNAEERVENVDQLMVHIKDAGIPLADVYIDCLAFPIGVASQYGNDYLDAVATIREQYGPEATCLSGFQNAGSSTMCSCTWRSKVDWIAGSSTRSRLPSRRCWIWISIQSR